MILRGTVFSRVLEMDTSITVVGPDAREGRAPHRVAYLLHGLCGNGNSWADNTMLPYYARNLDALFILPEVGRSFYTDLKYGQRFLTYVSEELPEIAARVFNISAKREDTLVMGGSMGGFGALKCALARPDFFGSCLAFAPCCLFLRDEINAFKTKGEEDAKASSGWVPNEQIKKDFLAMFGHGMELGPTDNMLALAGSVTPGLRPRIYMSCGLSDPFLPEVRRFAGKLRGLEFDVTYEEWEAGHNWPFFNTALQKGLAWSLDYNAGEDQGRYKKL